MNSKNTQTTPTSSTVIIQDYLRQPLKIVHGCKDYREEEELLKNVDDVLKISGLERFFIELSTEEFKAKNKARIEQGENVLDGADVLAKFQHKSSEVLRCNVLRGLMPMSYREMSKQLAKCELYRWFCRLEDFDMVRPPSKSTLQSYADWLPIEKMESILKALTAAVGDKNKAQIIGLESEMDMSMAWVDSTCLKANIHFPADWVLLRDATRTLVASILTIRRHGLKNRISDPKTFLTQMNALAMRMSAAGRKTGGKKERKSILRKMKRLTQVIEDHARRYRAILVDRREETDLSTAQAQVLLTRIDNVVGQLEDVRRQAHERIIGERQVANNKKILSLYEHDIHVIVRGKAGANVEFGNGLFIAENQAGFIIDHELSKKAAPTDGKWLKQRLPVLEEVAAGNLKGIAADRGFDSKSMQELLEKKGLFNAVCPKSPSELAKKVATDEKFVKAIKRRSQTEARIGILKNVHLGEIPRAKGFESRQLQVSWAVLAHNLRVVARMMQSTAAEKAPLRKAA